MEYLKIAYVQIETCNIYVRASKLIVSTCVVAGLTNVVCIKTEEKSVLRNNFLILVPIGLNARKIKLIHIGSCKTKHREKNVESQKCFAVRSNKTAPGKTILLRCCNIFKLDHHT
jgi:hypothetical protein